MKRLKLNKEEYPWYKLYKEGVPHHIDYPEGLLVDVIIDTALKHPNYIALEYYKTKITYKEFLDKIIECAKSLKTLGVKEGDVCSICMPNTPTAIIMFYAVNMVGAVANMIHPLSSEKEIELYLNISKSKFILTIDIDYKKVTNIINNTDVTKVIVSSAGDDLKGFQKTFYFTFKADLTKAIKKIKNVFLKAFQNREVISYKEFIKRGRNYYEDYGCNRGKDDLAVILYSGGTSGKPKGIMLSNLNFNALAYGSHYMCDPSSLGDSVLSIMPIFHGFGLGECIHTPLHIGMKCILIPTFKADKMVKLIRKKKPNFFVGVPTLYEAIYNSKKKKGDFASLNCIVSGGDVMDEENYNKYNKMFEEYGSSARIRVGYGLTEAAAATCLSPTGNHREGGIGVPFPDVLYKIVKIGTTKEAKTGEDGEICISGPTVMMGYINEEEETANTLKTHSDGMVWLHTGDVGTMDKDGFVYFKSRLKRIIISSGYNIYPSYIELLINKHEYVASSTIIGVPDQYRGQIVKAFIVLKKEVKLDETVEKEIKEYCEKNIAKYAMPKIFEFKKELPKTLVGKVAYTVLEEEEKLRTRAIETVKKVKPSKEEKKKIKKDKKASKKVKEKKTQKAK